EVAALTWGLAFENDTGGTFTNRFFGGRLFRAYSAPRDMLVDLSSAGPYSIGTGSVVTAQAVFGFSYNSSSRVLTQAQTIHSGTPFDYILSSPNDLVAQSILSTEFNTNGRVVAQTRSMT